MGWNSQLDVVIKSGVLQEEEGGHGPDDDRRVKAAGSAGRHFPVSLLSPATGSQARQVVRDSIPIHHVQSPERLH